MPLILSEYRVIHDPSGSPTTLLDFDDQILDGLLMDGRRIVQVQTFVRSVGVETFGRKNASRSFTFTKQIEETEKFDLHAHLFDWSLAIPRSHATIGIDVQNGESYELKNAAVESWSAAIVDDVARLSATFIGGQMDLVAP